MLELTALTKAYDGFEFGPVDLTVGGEVLSVLGPSGSGKTTLLSLVAGIVDPDGGSVTLCGRPLDGRSLRERRTGLVFQDGALFPHMTARENVAYAAADADRVDDLAATLEITEVMDRRPPTLSGGERQRVALARTLAADPDALLLDEPLSSLDAPIRRRLRRELRSFFESLSVPVVYVTHDQRTATALGDRIAVFRDGRVDQLGPPAEVLARPATRFVAQFVGAENRFEATVVSHDPTVVRAGDCTLRANADADVASVGSTVTVCVHPARVSLFPPGEASPVDAVNALSGRVDRVLNEGTVFRVEVVVDASSTTLVVTLQPPTFDRLSVDPGAEVGVAIRPEAVHPIPSPSR